MSTVATYNEDWLLLAIKNKLTRDKLAEAEIPSHLRQDIIRINRGDLSVPKVVEACRTLDPAAFWKWVDYGLSVKKALDEKSNF